MTTEIIAPEYGDIGTLTVRQRELPPPGLGQVRVAVRAVGVNPTDWKAMYSSWPRTSPVLIGFEAAGVVTALGPDIAAAGSLTVGDEVIAYPILGGYASDLLVPLDSILPKPATLDFPQAANLLLAGTTAAEMLDITGVRSGETILVHGASGATGVSLLQQVAQLQVRTIATASERKLRRHPLFWWRAGGLRTRARATGPRRSTRWDRRSPGLRRHRRGHQRLPRSGQGPHPHRFHR